MRSLALVIVLVCSTATAAPVLVTKDNYKSAADSPFDLAGGGYWLEDFEDGVVNTPGLSMSAQYVIDGSKGSVSLENGGQGHSIKPFMDEGVGTTAISSLAFEFVNLLPNQVGFVWTQSDTLPTQTKIEVMGANGPAGELFVTVEPNRFFGITFDDGIKGVRVTNFADVPASPYFQLDHIQYVPEPTTIRLVLGAVVCGLAWPLIRRPIVAFAALSFLLTSPAIFAVTTKDAPANHTVEGGKGRDGIVEVVTTHIGGAVAPYSGTLLPTRRHILTAAHAVSEVGTGTPNAQSVTINFHLASGVEPVTVTLPAVFGSGWNGDGTKTPDLAILQLSAPAPVAAESYEIYRNTDEIGKVADIVGFGNEGTGAKGQEFGTNAVRRAGRNQIDGDGSQMNGSAYSPGIVLVSDFDSGFLPNNSLFNAGVYSTHTGESNDEACIATYDSGSPALIGGKIAGVARAVSGWTTNPPDAVPGVLGSFGDILHHTRVSSQKTWYDQYVPPVVTSVIMKRSVPPFASYTVPTGSGIQLKSVPVGGINQIIVQFSEDVAPSATVEVKSIVGGGSYPVSTSFPTPRAIQFNFPAPIQHGGIPGDKVLITFGNVKKPGTTGASLDGDWTNAANRSSTGTSTYPSGDGTPGGGFLEFRVVVLPGDFNGDNIVNLSDWAIWNANQGTNKTYAQGDADGDGDVDNADYNIMLSNWATDWTIW